MCARQERLVLPANRGRGVWGHASPENFSNSGAQKCHFQIIKTKENAIISCLIDISSVIGRVQCLRNKGKKQ